ncbi:hypothetical protein [uncultured Abyssibacter sp.]|uniref:hypothetical protein n=1 Tax=uncultured Abyssibacter sp. TaxID=2320202 RepID=UPI0032B17CF7
MEERNWWTRDKRWRSSTIASGANRNHLWAFGFGVVVLGLAAPATLAIPDELGKGNWPILAVLLFDVVGLGLWALALRELNAWRRFGEINAVLDPWPGAVGGDIAGYFELRKPLERDHRITVTLTCRHHRRGNRHNTMRPVWTHSLSLQAMQPGEQQLWFHFEVPEGLPVSEPRAREYHDWLLRLEIRQPGADLVRQYDIPAFAGDANNRLAGRQTRIDNRGHFAALERLMNIFRSGDRVTLDFKSGRGWKGALAMIVFGLVSLGGAGFLVAVEGAPGGSLFEWIPWIMATVFALFGLMMIAAGLVWWGQRRIVLFDKSVVATRLFCFNLPIRTRQVSRETVTHFSWSRAGSMQSGTKVTVWYDLFVNTSDGRRLKVGGGFESDQAVRDGAARLAELTGIPLTDLKNHSHKVSDRNPS